MPNKIIHIHDTFIKDILSHKEAATNFFKEYLPGSLVQIINFETLTPLNTSYVGQNLKTSYSDLVWSVKLKNQKNVQISMLLEHKSHPDPDTAFQLLEYLALAYRKQRRETKKTELIIPVLYYHGKTDWKFKSLESFFSDLPDVLKGYLPAFLTEFVNLHRFPAEKILQLHSGLLSGALMIQKYFFDPVRLNSYFYSILERLQPFLYSNLIESVFVYLEYSGLNITQLEQDIQKLPEDMSTRIITLREQLLTQGKKEGILQGIAEERVRATQKTVLNAFDNGIDLLTIRLITDESEETINHILKENNRIG